MSKYEPSLLPIKKMPSFMLVTFGERTGSAPRADALVRPLHRPLRYDVWFIQSPAARAAPSRRPPAALTASLPAETAPPALAARPGRAATAPSPNARGTAAPVDQGTAHEEWRARPA